MPDRRLTITTPDNSYQVTLTKDTTTFGRSSKNDVILIDGLTSRNHAVMEPMDGGYQIRDLGSSNGTRLNGQKISGPEPLFLGDVIGMGRHWVKVEFGEPRPEPETEELTDDDLVDDAEDADAFVAADADLVDISPFDLVLGADDKTEDELEQLANNLPSQGFTAGQVELTDSKGQTVHAGGSSRKSLSDPGGAVELVRLLLMLAARARATDIHIEPREQTHAIRLRIDGIMVDITTVAASVGLRISSVVKILCQLDIAQRKIIQEGGFGARMPDENNPRKPRRVDYRVSFAPAILGQKLVIRILDSTGVPTKIADLGLPPKFAELVSNVIHKESGMLLVVGPTGSGKTTTLYSLLRSIDLARRNVVTIEDPVEVHLDGITQIPVDDKHDRSFIQVLRSVLRQDPDVILVGEIRDSDTARVAMQAAITGHMVFSTLHTRDTIGTIFRLRDLGVETYMLGQSLQLIIAQRLIRQLCPFCKAPVKPTPQQLQAMGPTHANLKKMYRAVGCSKCLGIGHWGRRAFFELLTNNQAISRAILSNASREDLIKTIAEGEFVTLQNSAYQLVAEGHVDFAEVDGEIKS